MRGVFLEFSVCGNPAKSENGKGHFAGAARKKCLLTTRQSPAGKWQPPAGCVVFSALSMYSLILSEQIKQVMCHQREIADQRQHHGSGNAATLYLQHHDEHTIFRFNNILCCIHSCDADFKTLGETVFILTAAL